MPVFLKRGEKDAVSEVQVPDFFNDGRDGRNRDVSRYCLFAGIYDDKDEAAESIVVEE